MAFSNRNECIWMALQICDSSFPGGALANSNGLESAISHGLVSRNNADTLKSYIMLILDQVNCKRSYTIIFTKFEIITAVLY